MNPGVATSWTDDEKARLADLTAGDLSSSVIAKMMGRTRNSVIGMARRSGLRIAGAGTRAMIAELAARGEPMTRIADLLALPAQPLARHWRRICAELGETP